MDRGTASAASEAPHLQPAAVQGAVQLGGARPMDRPALETAAAAGVQQNPGTTASQPAARSDASCSAARSSNKRVMSDTAGQSTTDSEYGARVAAPLATTSTAAVGAPGATSDAKGTSVFCNTTTKTTASAASNFVQPIQPYSRPP